MSYGSARRLAWAVLFVGAALITAACTSPSPDTRVPTSTLAYATPSLSAGSTPAPTATSPVSAPQDAGSTLPSATPQPSPSPTASPSPTPTVVGPARIGKASAPAVSAAFAIVLDEASGQVLFEKGAHSRTPPASVTKIMTAIIAIERGAPGDRVRANFDPTALDPDSTLMGIRPGDEMTLEDLLYGLMLPSGNDAALAIANQIAGSEDAFVELMNARARDLGLKDTQFRNPHGLHEAGHYSSAYDMAMLARYGMTHHPLFARLAAAKYWAVKGKRPLELYNLNKLLIQYKGGDGVKVGYTEQAGKTFVGSATRGGHRVYVSLMKSQNLWDDSLPLLDWAFGSFTWPPD